MTLATDVAVYPIHRETYMIGLNHLPTWERFRDRQVVTPGSYAERIARGIWRNLFVMSPDLRFYYETFYAPEYSSFLEYVDANIELFDHHLLDGRAEIYVEQVGFFREHANEVYQAYQHVLWVDNRYSILQEERGAELLASMIGGLVICE
jgi:hypothetical protein